jgi:hypothetical protein
MKKLGFLLLPLLLSLNGCTSMKTITLSGEDVSESETASTTITSLSFSGFSFQDSTYKITILPVSAEHPSGYVFTHSSNLMGVTDFAIEKDGGYYGFSTKKTCQLTGGSFDLTLYAALSSLTIDGGVSCTFAGVASFFTIKVNGAATLASSAPLSLKWLQCKVDGAATISLSGDAEAASYDFSGASSLKAAEFKTETTVINIDGAGSAQVYASHSFQGTVNGTGSITYYGNPSSVLKKVDGLGSIQPAA